MRISEVATKAGVNVQTLRYYERRGLLTPPPRTPSGYRVYEMDTVYLVRFIKRVQELGFSLTDIEQLLRLQDGSESIPADVLLQQMLLDVRARKRDLQTMDTVLSTLLSGGPSTYESCQAFLVSALEPSSI